MNEPQEATRDARPSIEQELSDLDGDVPRRRAHGALVAFRELQGKIIRPSTLAGDEAWLTYSRFCGVLASHARTILSAYPADSAGYTRWRKVHDVWWWAGEVVALRMRLPQAQEAHLWARKALDIGSPEWLYSIHGDDIGNGAGR